MNKVTRQITIMFTLKTDGQCYFLSAITTEKNNKHAYCSESPT